MKTYNKADKWIGIVRWNGNHYFSGEEVEGSEIKVTEGKLFLYHDKTEEIYIGGNYLGETTRNVWVEVKEVKLIENK